MDNSSAVLMYLSLELSASAVWQDFKKIPTLIYVVMRDSSL